MAPTPTTSAPPIAPPRSPPRAASSSAFASSPPARRAASSCPRSSTPIAPAAVQYVKIPANTHGPVYAWHNHDTAIAECPNGDLLAIWYTCEQERGRELAVASARLPRGAAEWQPARLFWDVPDRNDHAPALWFDGADTLYHFNGLGPAGRWQPLAIVMRTSTDSGRTWSPAQLIAPEFGYRNMVGQPVIRTRDGAIVFGADAAGGSAIWVSRDNGKTWADPGGSIRGIHAGIVERKDGSLFALGRGQNIDGYAPASVSRDMGRTWQYAPSGLPPLGGGQRLVLLRLKDGSLFLASFAEDVAGFSIPGRRPHTNLFAALSFDEGRTWPVRRLIPADARDGIGTIDGGWTGKPEAQGYLSGTQARDGLIHLISSWNHYAFNVAWLKAAAPLTPPPPVAKELPRREVRAAANAAVDPRRGATFEFAPGEFFLSVRTGPLTANQYRVKVERGRVARLALRADTAAQLYIDGRLDRVLPAELVIDWREPARGTYWKHTAGPVKADATGAWAPR